jgi:hypothetical protein
MVYYAMGTREMAVSDILLECQCREWDHNKWTELRSIVTHDDIVTAINGLIKDGLVQEVTIPSSSTTDDGMIDDFTATRYKRCNQRVPEQHKEHMRCSEYLQSRYGSRRLKFSKPWKKRFD